MPQDDDAARQVSERILREAAGPRVIRVVRQGRATAKRNASETTGGELVTLLTGGGIAAQ